ncbi:MAG: DUF1289 domain-containing protein [Gammaproteobacteria bacterium]|nr:DUF1289 domain-containing protein [Pseudomonadales bacterium]MCP5346010.1 DUF1289 domain-containing protein [Pseudomonadales bacterium]
MNKIRTPCIGICSTTSVGDPICRGCKRYAFEVINWNAYSDAEKLAVLERVEKLNVQILENRLELVSEARLREGLRNRRVPFDETRSPYCWIHNLLKRCHNRIESLQEFGLAIRPDYNHCSLAELCEQIDREILSLCEAHFDRYLAVPESRVADLG